MLKWAHPPLNILERKKKKNKTKQNETKQNKINKTNKQTKKKTKHVSTNNALRKFALSTLI